MKRLTKPILSLIFPLLGCDVVQVPADAILSVAPSHKTFEISSSDSNPTCSFSTELYQDVPLLFTLQTSDGSPIGDAELLISSDYTSNNFSGVPVLGLYDDKNSNGVIDGPSELVSSAMHEGFRTKTSRYGGERMLWARVYLACPFSAEIFASSGPVSGAGRISVVVRGSAEPDDPAIDDSSAQYMSES